MIFNNVIPDNKHKLLIDFITSLDFPWYYQPNIAFVRNTNKHNNEDVIQSFGLTHTVWDVEKGMVSEALAYVEPIVDNFQKISNVKINNFLRIKINLQTPIPGNSSEKYNGAHVDGYAAHKTLIYYPSDSDGYTFIFNEFFNPDDPLTYPNKVIPTVKEKISPKKNTLYFLNDGFQYHSSSNPITCSKRYSININFN
jgi:hypothetical protein